MRKKAALFLGLILALSSLAGCAKEAEPTEAAETSAAAGSESTAGGNSNISLVFAIDLGSDEAANQLTKEIISEYEAKTGVSIQLESMPMGDYRTWLTTQFSAGEGPDVYTGILYDITSDYDSGWLYNFKDLYEEESTYDQGQPWKDSLPESILERMYIDSNTVPGYPSATSVVRIFCNKDLFNQAGAEIPNTWEEFMTACEKLKESGVTPFGFPNATIADLSWLWFNNSISSQLNGQLVDELDESGNGFVELSEIAKGMDEGKIDFTQPGLQEGFELMKEFSNYWTSDYNGLDQATAIDMFMRGEVAMVQALSTDLSKIQVGVEDRFAYEVMPVPVITKDTSEYALGKSVILGGQPDIIYAINKNVEQDEAKLQAAVRFVQYMASPDIQARYAEGICRIPLALSTPLPESLSGFIITEESLRMPYYTGINEKLRNYFHRAGQQYLEGSLSTVEFGEMINNSYTEVLEEIKTEKGWSAENNYGISE